MHFSVLCAEDIARVDHEMIARETAGTFLGDYLIGGYAEVCEVWPYARLEPSFWEPVASDVPALLLSGARDPVTPPSGGDAVAQHLGNSLHIVVPGSGHGAGGPCVSEIERRFVETGSIEGLDTSCLEADHRPSSSCTRATVKPPGAADPRPRGPSRASGATLDPLGERFGTRGLGGARHARTGCFGFLGVDALARTRSRRHIGLEPYNPLTGIPVPAAIRANRRRRVLPPCDSCFPSLPSSSS